MSYVDGFVIPVPKARLDEYRKANRKFKRRMRIGSSNALFGQSAG